MEDEPQERIRNYSDQKNKVGRRIARLFRRLFGKPRYGPYPYDREYFTPERMEQMRMVTEDAWDRTKQNQIEASLPSSHNFQKLEPAPRADLFVVQAVEQSPQNTKNTER